jgi:pyruvate kinase
MRIEQALHRDRQFGAIERGQLLARVDHVDVVATKDLRVARERPKSPIVAISPKLSTCRRLALTWGVHSILAEDAHDLDDMVERACRLAFKDGFARTGQRVIIVAGVPLGTPGATNMLRIAFLGATGDSNA